MLEAVEARACASAYHLVVSSALDEVSRKGRVDGVVVLGSPANEMFSTLSDRRPAVFVYNSYELRPNLVGWSDEEGMQLAVQHLVDLGHRRIAALFCYGKAKYTPPTQDTGIYRADEAPVHCPRAVLAQHPKVSGFRKAVQRAGIQAIECWEAPRPDQILQGHQFENGYLATRRLLSEKQAFTAIVARNDFLALGALRALREFGVCVPQEVSVIGYTDSLHALCADPPLTSVLTPIAKAGELAVERLIRSIEKGEEPLSGAILSTSLTIRLSCAPPPGGVRQRGGEARSTPTS
jgi:DNA-binding LacI/PurR family transcriptional regulator